MPLPAVGALLARFAPYIVQSGMNLASGVAGGGATGGGQQGGTTLGAFTAGSAPNVLKRTLEKFEQFSGPLGRAFTGLAKLSKGAEIAGTALIELHRDVSRYNAQSAAAVARLDVNRLRRAMTFSNQTAGSLDMLTRSQDRLEQANQPMDIFVTRLTHAVQSGINNVTAAVQEFFTPLYDIGNEILDWLGVERQEKDKKEKDGVPLFFAWLRQQGAAYEGSIKEDARRFTEMRRQSYLAFQRMHARPFTMFRTFGGIPVEQLRMRGNV